ncbi:homing endonuclease associated repeat-containing protein [Latilactobacillus sakei]|uniref:Uncharacterized protein n=1 Tax=Latilactobacillus sakei TaxID=1599 RepID=A0AAF0K3J5_LATSK|nr:hypothetical protein [Latilactobacillus sakei]WGI18544.1 hypothetical protein QBD03_07235 [Latilactobacillus sakei]
MPESTKGFNNWTVRGKYTRETFINEIKKRYEETGSIPDQKSFHTHAAYYLFGSWTDALILAGITPNEVKGDSPVIRQFLIQEIQKTAISLNKVPNRIDYSRSQKATSLFGSWDNFLKAAKIEYRLFIEEKEVK